MSNFMLVMYNLLQYVSKFPIVAISVFIPLMPIIILSIRRGLESPLRIFLYYSILKLTGGVIAILLASCRMNSLFVCDIWNLITFIFIANIFKNLFIKDFEKKVILHLIYIFTGVFFIDMYLSNDNLLDLHNHLMNNIFSTLSSFTIMLFCIYFYVELLNEIYIENVERWDIFWLVSAIFIYHSASIICNVIDHFYFRWDSVIDLMIVAHVPYIAEIITTIMFSIGLLKSIEQKISYDK